MDEFLQTLASKEPVPGGGSVAALQLALGSALLSMVCRLTLGREKFASVAGPVAAIEQEAASGLSSGRRLVDGDADAFRAVARAMKLPRSTDEEKLERRQAVQSALKAAVDPPLETMQRASRGLEMAAQLVPIGNPSAVSDVGTAALCFQSAFHAARLNVEINLASIRDEAFNTAVRAKMPSSNPIDATRDDIVKRVIATIGADS